MRPKVTIIGAGNVGATAAWQLAQRGIADLQLVDVVEGLAQGKALDMAEALPLLGRTISIRGSTDLMDARDSQIVVITAGIARKPGMSREDLLQTNAGIMRPLVERVARVASTAVLIIVTNPLDVMAALAHQVSGFPRERVLGMAGALDAARLRCFVAERLQVAVEDVDALVLGSHGDEMVPVPRYTTVNGVALTELLPAGDIDQLMQRTRDGGAEIVKYLKTGSAYYAPGTAVVSMVESILLDARRLMAASVALQGEYGLRDVFIGVPVMLGAGGVASIVQLKLTAAEAAALRAAAERVRAGIQLLSAAQPK